MPSPAKYEKGNDYSYNPNGTAAIKQQLLAYRGVSFCINAESSRPDWTTKKWKYLSPNWAQYTYDSVFDNSHSVCIVGWDDDYPKENFNEGHQPPENGAFLARKTMTIPRKTSTRDTNLPKMALFWPGTAGDPTTMTSPRTGTGTGESSRKRTNITVISGYPIMIGRCNASRRLLLTRATSARATMCSSTIMRQEQRRLELLCAAVRLCPWPPRKRSCVRF